jgi:RNA recognition motif-containing protein
MNIFISNLSFRVNDDDLKTLFDEYGEVFSAKVITDKFSGKSRGFGFVEMNNEKEAQNAIDKLNQAKFEDKIISVSVAKPRTERSSNSSYNDRKRY